MHEPRANTTSTGLPGPTPVHEWADESLFVKKGAKPKQGYLVDVTASRFRARVYPKPNADTKWFASAREGATLKGRPTGLTRGCNGGWVELALGGYACSSGSFRLSDKWQSPNDLAPELSSALPYRYGQVVEDGAPRFVRVPTLEEEQRATKGDKIQPLDVHMKGDYFLTIADKETHDGRAFFRTLRDKYVRAQFVKEPTSTTMHGAHLKPGTLPLAFVIDRDAPLYNNQGDKLRRVGKAEHYARFSVAKKFRNKNTRYLANNRGIAVKRKNLRVARKIAPPSEVGKGEKWIHVDLSEQVLVAYQGKTPRFATLVSTGKKGYETPTGLFRVRHKHLSATMTGDDPKDGRYEVGEVPWVLYYYKSYALHGAYWHDEFGRVRSHGCTNLPPADARWLLHWTAPTLPQGLHSIRTNDSDEGTIVYVSGETISQENE